MFHHGELEGYHVANAAATGSTNIPISISIRSTTIAVGITAAIVGSEIERALNEHLRRGRGGRVRNVRGERLRIS